MVNSGSRGTWGQITQMMGMKGLVTNPVGETIELPIRNSFKEGLDVLEYFISTHGGRKGLTDTALRTASAGYLTRRLVDVAQDVVVIEEDCGDKEGLRLTKEESEKMGESLAKRVTGRVVLEDIIHPKTKKIIIKKGELITKKIAQEIEKIDLKEIRIRSILTCKTKGGLCRKCYGYDLGYNQLVELGAAVGIVAAQSIGEPGVQLTLRTFHTGGVLGKDITQGLPRVEELFEARAPKREAILAEISGRVKIVKKDNQKKILIRQKGTGEEKYLLTPKEKVFLKVKDGEKIKKDMLLFKKNKKEIKAKHSGK